MLAGFISGLPFVAGAALHPAAATGLVPCDTNCGFNDLMILANNIIDFILYKVVVPLIALGFMWVGGNLIFNQEKVSAWDEAKKSFLVMAQGVFIIIGAFLLIKFVLFQFLTEEQATFTRFLIG